jgi:hypothetical protein
MRTLVLLALFLHMPMAMAGGIFGNNKIEDSFSVKSVEGNQAVVTGKPAGLKVGDYLYFNRSPFRFQVTAIEGEKVTVALPERHELKPGFALLRNANDQIKKSIDTESRLKKALEE